MTGRPAFGDFIAAADRLLIAAGWPATPAAGGERAGQASELGDVAVALRHLVIVTARYLRDFAAIAAQVPAPAGPVLTIWGRASVETRAALHEAVTLLEPVRAGRGRPAAARPSGTLAWRIDSAATVLGAAHDLLASHIASRPDGSRAGHSEWAPVITSIPVTRTLLAEIGSVAGLAASQCDQVARSASRPPGSRAAQAELGLRLACQRLQAANAAAQHAALTDPPPPEARDLLHAIPVSAREPRAVPQGGETIRELAAGAIASAERIRHLARTLARDAAWSPATSGTSLRHAAAASVATSYHCEVVLKTIADHPGTQTRPGHHGLLVWSADALSAARAAWLRAAHVWDQMNIDAPKTLSHAAAETGDLALWTGCLAFADQEWTLSRGPSRAVRPPQDLAADAEDTCRVVAAVHHAAETLTRLAQTDYRQIQVAARARRLLVPTSSLPEEYDVPHPMAQAPPRTGPSCAGRISRGRDCQRAGDPCYGRHCRGDSVAEPAAHIRQDHYPPERGRRDDEPGAPAGVNVHTGGRQARRRAGSRSARRNRGRARPDRPAGTSTPSATCSSCSPAPTSATPARPCTHLRPRPQVLPACLSGHRSMINGNAHW